MHSRVNAFLGDSSVSVGGRGVVGYQGRDLDKPVECGGGEDWGGAGVKHTTDGFVWVFVLQPSPDGKEGP